MRLFPPILACLLLAACTPTGQSSSSAPPAETGVAPGATSVGNAGVTVPPSLTRPAASPIPDTSPAPASVPSLSPAASPSALSASPVASPGTGATIDLRNAQGDMVGQATFMPDAANAVQLTVRITDLDPGEHGIHIHMVGRCDPPDFMSAGDHFNPTGAQHGLNNPQGPHAGDLPGLTVGPDRHATYQATTGAVTLRPGPTSIYDADGSALVIYAQPDDQMTDPSGNSGARIACGVIPPAQ